MFWRWRHRSGIRGRHHRQQLSSPHTLSEEGAARAANAHSRCRDYRLTDRLFDGRGCRRREEAVSKSSRVIVLTLSLSALALVTDYSGRATAATSDKTKPARGKAAMTNGITPANVLITGKACDHKLTPRSATLH